MNLKLISALAAGLLMSAPTFAATVTLDFEGTPASESIGDFYNGGAGGNYGISFGGDAQAWEAAFSTDLPIFDRPENGARILTVVGDIEAPFQNGTMNVASGFAGAFSFDYASTAATTISLFSGLDGTGELLTTIDLTGNSADCTTSVLCLWNAVSVEFGGVARSVTFGDAAFVAGFDNVSVNAVPLPAAGWLLMSALGGLGIFSRRKRAA